MKDISNLTREQQIEYCKTEIANVVFERTENFLTEKSDTFLRELGEQFNQCFHILKFKVTNEFELSMGSLGTLSFLTEVLNQKSLSEFITDLGVHEDKYNLTEDVKGISSLYSLLGDLCSTLIFGGAYGCGTTLKDEELIKTVKDFIDDFLPDGYKNYDYFATHEAWAKWFCKVAWDYTFIIFNRNRKELNLICLTDSD